MLPSLHERGKNGKLDGFDLLAQRSQRAPAADLYDASGAPLDEPHFPPELPANELAGALPLREPRLDPLTLPTVTIVHFERSHGPRLRQKPRKNFAPGDGRIDR